MTLIDELITLPFSRLLWKTSWIKNKDARSVVLKKKVFFFIPPLTSAQVEPRHGSPNIVWLSARQFVLRRRPAWMEWINTKASKQKEMMPLLPPALVRKGRKQSGGGRRKQDSWISIEIASLWSESWYQRDSSRSSERRWWHGKPFVTDLLGSSLLGSSLLGRLKLLVPLVKMDKN